MKNFLLFILGLFLISPVFAQDVYVPDLSSIGPDDTIPNDSLIVSEVYIRSHRLSDVMNNGDFRRRWSYFELTNMSTQPMDMNRYYYRGKGIGNSLDMTNQNKLNMKGILPPGESYLVVIPYPTEGIYVDGQGNPLYPNGLHANKEILDMADTVSTWIQHQNSWDLMIYNRYRNPVTGLIDSAYVDCFGNNGSGETDKKVAGVVSPNNDRSAWDYVWVRRTLVKKGSLNWNEGRGTDLSDSEWMPIPYEWMYKYTDLPFTTVKKHGKVDPDNFIASKTRVDIDNNAMTITIPYGVKRDSVFREFNIQPNVGWNYKMNDDTSQYFVQTGDTLEFYLMGDSLVIKRFHAIVSTDLSKEAHARPFIYNVAPKTWERKWDVSEGQEPMDTIGPIPFGTPVDTFTKYTIFDGNHEIVFANGASSEVKAGDLLKVTSPDKSTSKTYKIAVDPYFPSQDALLSTVIFPGLELWENPETFLFVDTFLTFLESGLQYRVDLPAGTNTTPQIIAIPRDPNAMVSVKNPSNLLGTLEERTMTVTCTAEDGIRQTEYKFEFWIERDEPELEYTPFFSDVWVSTGMLGYWTLQIYNPDLSAVDLSDYLIAWMPGNTTVEEFITNSIPGDTSRFVHRPGYMVVKDPLSYEPIFAYDFNQSTSYLPARNVYSISPMRAFPNYQTNLDPTHNGTPAEYSRCDFVPNYSIGDDASHVFEYANGYRTYSGAVRGQTIALLKINNDSVLEGTKAMNDIIDDYEVVDMINGFSTIGVDWAVGDVVDGRDTVYDNAAPGTIYRKSETYRGNPVDRASFGVIADDTVVVKKGEWIAGDSDNPPTQTYRILKVRSRFDNFYMNYTDHLPYVASKIYTVSDGITLSETINNVETNTTVSTLLSKIAMPNPKMTVMVMDASGNVKTANETVVAGDQLKSISARGIDSVIYTISTGTLSDDVLLVSSDYTINMAGDKTTGTISNIPFGVTFVDMLSKITNPAMATSALVYSNDTERQFPMIAMSADTNLVGEDLRMDVIANDMAVVKVTAQNGSVCIYSLVFADVEVPYILSNVYKVIEDEKYIDNLSIVSVSTLLSNLIASPGATIKVLDKVFGERTVGMVNYEDRVKVTKGNKSVIYGLKFLQEPGTGQGIDESVKGVESLTLDVFPNPTTGKFMLNNLSVGDVIAVYNVAGIKISESIVTGKSHALDLSNSAKGIYLVKVAGKAVKVIVE